MFIPGKLYKPICSLLVYRADEHLPINLCPDDYVMYLSEKELKNNHYCCIFLHPKFGLIESRYSRNVEYYKNFFDEKK
jgi:hypothetical protein